MWFIGAQICTAVFLAISSGLLFAKARGRGGPAISACLLVFGLWALNTAISHGTSSLSGKLLLEGLWYLSGAFMPSLFLLSTLRFANSSRAVPLFWLILLAWHLLIGILALSNGSHGLLWTSPRISELGTLSYDRTLLNIINLFILLFEVLSSLVYWLQRSIIQRGIDAAPRRIDEPGNSVSHADVSDHKFSGSPQDLAGLSAPLFFVKRYPGSDCGVPLRRIPHSCRCRLRSERHTLIIAVFSVD
jgi:hypothetical protein